LVVNGQNNPNQQSVSLHSSLNDLLAKINTFLSKLNHFETEIVSRIKDFVENPAEITIDGTSNLIDFIDKQDIPELLKQILLKPLQNLLQLLKNSQK
jgi:transcriptional regulator of heat shock response